MPNNLFDQNRATGPLAGGQSLMIRRNRTKFWMVRLRLILLLVLAGNVFVFGQELRIQFRPSADTVIVLGPDRMPCVVSSLEGVERMPVKKLDSRLMVPMPNGMQREGWGLRVMPPSGSGLSPAPMPGPGIKLLPPKKRKWQ